jgi:hypothetical protein
MNMRTSLKRTLSVVLSASFVISACSCNLLKDKASDEVLDAAEAYAKNIAACDLAKLKKLSDKNFEKKTADWADLLEFKEGDIYNDNAADFASAVADTISYEIDEESVEASSKKGSGSVDVTFTMADYEDLLNDEEITDVVALVDAIGDADTQEIKVTLEFEGEDGDWLVTNYGKVFDKVYVFTDVTEINYRLPIAECLDYTQWNGCDNNANDGYYTNTSYIDFEMYCDWDVVDVTEIYYTVEYGGTEIYSLEGSNLGYFQTGLSGAPLDDSGDYLAAGDYTITFYDAVDDSVIISGVAHVSVEAVATPAPSTAPTTVDLMYTDDYNGLEGEIQYYSNISSEYVNLVDRDFTEWYDPETNYSNFGLYPSGSTMIQFSVSLNSEYDGATFRVFYLPDGTTPSSVDITGRAEPELNYYNNFPFYDCNVDITDYGTGYYVIGVYASDAADSEPCIVSVCYVQ